MRDVYVATLYVFGFFLLSYKGYQRIDDIISNLGCVFAVGSALFPTTPPEGGASSGVQLIGEDMVPGNLFILIDENR
jgi:hypothetical protein